LFGDGRAAGGMQDYPAERGQAAARQRPGSEWGAARRANQGAPAALGPLFERASLEATENLAPSLIAWIHGSINSLLLALPAQARQRPPPAPPSRPGCSRCAAHGNLGNAQGHACCRGRPAALAERRPLPALSPAPATECPPAPPCDRRGGHLPILSRTVATLRVPVSTMRSSGSLHAHAGPDKDHQAPPRTTKDHHRQRQHKSSIPAAPHGNRCLSLPSFSSARRIPLPAA
jgi:hypothetical protein